MERRTSPGGPVTDADGRPISGTDAGGGEVRDWIRTTGLTSWYILGIAGALGLGALLFATTRDITIPLLVAVVLGAIFVPLVDWLQKFRVPRWLGTLIVMALLMAVTVGILALVITGIVDQAEEIGRQIQAGVDQLEESLAGVGFGEDLPSRVKEQVTSSSTFLSGGIVGAILGGLSSAASFLVGVFIAVNILFFVLKDAHAIFDWLQARASGVVATTLLGDSARAMRAYFRGKALVGLSSAVTVLIGALLVGVPLPTSIALVTFFTSFIPYLGAIIAGAYAVLLALGSGGFSDALLVLAVVVIANAVVESLVTPFAVGAELRLHPLVVLVVTILGGMVAGLIGVTLAAPATSIAVEVVGKLRAAGVFDRRSSAQAVVPRG
ncbi:MAG TPA: AI-2E family transporter [Actinomycetota bacterium]|nr:AI-2E family transporter [Actinomycetota bacterium]